MRKNFNSVSNYVVKLHRHHPSISPSYSAAIFHVSLYSERLLFFQNLPLPFNGNLLFVPIVLQSQRNRETGKSSFTKIHSWYLAELTKEDENWEDYCLELIFRKAGDK